MSDQPHNPADRNDPAIAPDTDPDAPQKGQTHDKPQGQPDTQFEQNQQSGGNTYTPDYEPEEKPTIEPSNPQPVTGRDADIDTDGG